MDLRLRWRSLAVVGVLVAAAMGTPHRASGQIGQVWGPERVPVGTSFGMFVPWTGERTVDGFLVDVPPDWTLRRANVLRHGYEPVETTLRRAADREGRYVVRAGRPLRGMHELSLEIETGPATGGVEVVLTPFVDEGTRREERARAVPVAVVAPPAQAANHALAFSGGAPLLLDRRLPALGTDAPFTVEFWIKTTGLDEVVLSAWDGDEARAYPAELVVAANGRLVFYRGRPGAHQSMTTTRPVADGAWHHVAVVNAPGEGYVRLFHDGRPADSLRSTPSFTVPAPRSLALGGRIARRARADAQATYAAFTGSIDELRLLQDARSAAAVRLTMRRSLPTRVDGDVVLDFEAPVPRELLARPVRDAVRVPTDLAFYQPVRDLRAAVTDAGIALTWETPDPQTEAFVIERSTEGTHFEEVGRVRSMERSDADPARWAFTDAAAHGSVLYYRIRQVLEDGAERLSATVKLGLGGSDAPAVFVANFPNPFNTATTITYEVQTSGHVRLSIWDVAGVRVATLVDAVREPGRYEHYFEAEDLPSGTYFIRLQADGGVRSSTMVLSK